MSSPLQTVKRALQAYLDKDRPAIEAVIADEYRFTSPRDNALDRDTYFARCWPASEVMTEMDLLHGTEDGELAWIVYEATIGTRFRNAELHRVRDGRIVETQVFFGWSLPHPAAAGGFIDDEGADPG
jgi:ketosteroid isomerase-like protein